MIRRCRLPAAVLFADNETLEQVGVAPNRACCAFNG